MAHNSQFPGIHSVLATALASLAVTSTNLLLVSDVLAQSSLPEVRVQAGSEQPARERSSVGGIGDEPVSSTPQSISIIRTETMRDLGASSLSSAIRSETSAGDAYNTLGYVETLQVRGFTLDNALNYRRDGLMISNHAPMAFENKEGIEILKGVSGMQSGVSAPGGMINYVVKRPTATNLRDVYFGLSERGTTLLHGDLGGRSGRNGMFGYRINVAAEERRPEVHDAPGHRQFLSGYFDLRLPNAALLEAEFEHHRVSQRSVPGFGLLDTDGDGVADTLPGPINPRINLNDQSWSQPFQSENTVGSLRFQQAFATSWFYGLRYGAQNIRTNDRTAFPDGCSSGANYLYPGFCGNYDVDIYDYRSDNERRNTRTMDAFVRGDFSTGSLRHHLTAGITRTRYEEGYELLQAYNWVGIDNVFNRQILPGDPTPSSPNTLRTARTDEVYLTDSVKIGRLSIWGGLRHTQLTRASERTDGSESQSYNQSFTTPWGAIGYQPWDGGFAYLSAGQGVESEVVPNRPSTFINYGAVLPALKSHQVELGYKHVLPGAGLASVAIFDISKPYSEDLAQFDGSLLRVADGRQVRHRGLELGWTGRPIRSLSLTARATLIDSETTRALDPALVGKRATNVAPLTANFQAGWQLPGVSGLTWINRAHYAAGKAVTSDNSIELPSYWQFDTAFVYRHKTSFGRTTWRFGIDNLFDRRYWRDAPTQYWGGVYLFPGMPRTARATVQLSF
jgi:iron complex outermembrane receptor protein